MKNRMNPAHQSNIGIMLAALIMLLLYPACDDPSSPEGSLQYNIDSFIIGPEGGTFRALNGNVSLNIPAGSVKEEINISIEEGPIDNEGDFVIKSIEVSPKTVLFNNPVGLSLKYKGQLNCGNDVCKAKNLVIYHFNNDKDFDLRKPSDMLWISSCCLNQMDCCIETEIQGGGIYAIGEASLGQPAISQP